MHASPRMIDIFTKLIYNNIFERDPFLFSLARRIFRFLFSLFSLSLSFSIFPSTPCNGNQFASIKFHRYAAETILGKHSTMEIRSIHLGGMFHAEEEIQMTSTMANFVGQLQGFIYNGNR